MWTSNIITKLNTSTAWWNRQATIRNRSCGGVIDSSNMVCAIEQRKNPEPVFLTRSQRVVIQIIDDMIRVHHMTPVQGFTQVNPQGAGVRLRPTLYSPWWLHPTAFSNAYYMVIVYPHLSPTGYARRHIDGY